MINLYVFKQWKIITQYNLGKTSLANSAYRDKCEPTTSYMVSKLQKDIIIRFKMATENQIICWGIFFKFSEYNPQIKILLD